ncbi:cupin domain-containing protein [Thalassospira alkalitolerans]|uniref:cupin domain-containing protein n=1 Tax=Thalassospira alkalitolerans TaxID=1293890 RepID=UPI003AA8F3DD
MSGDITIDQLIEKLGLQPHPEGGYYAETFRAGETCNPGHRYLGARSTGTAIYYLLTPDTFSGMHILTSDEIFHHYLGDPVEQLQLFDDGNHRRVEIGKDLLAGQKPQMIVPKNVWQGARLKPGGTFSLLGCTVAPGFDFADFSMGKRAGLIAKWPGARDMIAALTRD